MGLRWETDKSIFNNFALTHRASLNVVKKRVEGRKLKLA